MNNKQAVVKSVWVTVLYLAVFQLTTALVSWALNFKAVLAGKQSLLELANQSGAAYIIGVLVGLGVIYYCSQKEIAKGYWQNTAGLPRVKGVLLVVILLLALQALTSIYSGVVESLLNALGYSATQQVKNATGSGNTWTFMLYTALLAPIAEEIVFRGYLLQHLKKYGAKLALLVSAGMFALAHANVIQTPFAFLLGLILGAIALRYGLFWAILAHLFNNWVIGDLLAAFYKLLPAGNAINTYVSLAALVLAVIIWIYQRKNLKRWAQNNKITQGLLRSAFLSLPAILLICWSLFQMITTLGKK